MRHVIALLALTACFDNAVQPATDPIESHVVRLEVPLSPAPRLDLLVVVDRSTAMRPHLESLAANLPRMIGAIEPTLPSLHLGVVSAEGGALDSTAAVDGDFIVDLRLTDGTRLRNYEGPLADAFTALVAPRADSTARVQPLEAMRDVLSTHSTFRRRDAYLLVVFLAGTDDASPGEPQVYADFLHDLAPNRVAVTAALPCDGAPKLERFLAAFEHRAHASSLCDADLSELLAFASIKSTLAGPPCLPALADGDPDVAGVQPTCAAELAFGDGGGDILPSCAEGSAPCWKAVLDPQSCPFDDGYAFVVERALLDELPFETIMRADCLAE